MGNKQQIWMSEHLYRRQSCAIVKPMLQEDPRVFTIGHSTRSWEEFLSLLQAHGSRQLADVRIAPSSRRFPHFNRQALIDSLPGVGIDYRHFFGLGGRRTARPDSPNAGWRNANFRGYADYLATHSFLEALESLMVWARHAPTVVMCAEAVPWRCHRSLIADALVIRGWAVCHIIGEKRADFHKLTEFAHVEGDNLTYPESSTGSLFIP